MQSHVRQTWRGLRSSAGIPENHDSRLTQPCSVKDRKAFGRDTPKWIKAEAKPPHTLVPKCVALEPATGMDTIP